MKNKLFLLFLTFSCVISIHAQVNDTIINWHQKSGYNVTVTQRLGFLQPEVFGEPRTPLKSSFYNEEMLKHDWRYQEFGQFIYPIEYTLFGLQNNIKTSGSVIVYDASVTSVADKATLNNNGIEVFKNDVFVNASGRTLQIPINYSGDNSIDANSLSNGEKRVISEYVNKSLAHSGVTPSSVKIIANNGDFNISVVKSNYTNEDKIIEGYNIRSRVGKSELIEGIKKDIESVNLSRAKDNLEIATNKFPKNTELQELNARYEELKALNFINSNRKTCAIRLIEESPKEFIVQDGLEPQKNYGIQNKPDFIKDLANSIGNETHVVYLDVRGMGNEKSEAFVISTNIQIKTYRPEVVVKAAPKEFRKLFFEGEVVQKSPDILPIIDDYSGIQTYNVKLEGQTWKIGLGLEVKAFIERAKSKNLIKSFFSFFDKRISKDKGWNLSDAVNSTRKDVQKKYRDIKVEDYDAFIKNELLGINIVFIRLIEEDKILISATNDK